MNGDERGIARFHDRELEPEALGVREVHAAGHSLGRNALAAEALLPEVEGSLRGDAPGDAVDHAGAGSPSARARVLEEGDVGTGAALLVCIEEVVDRRVVLVHRLFDETKTEHARVEVDVARRVARDAGHVVDSVQLQASLPPVPEIAYAPAAFVRL